MDIFWIPDPHNDRCRSATLTTGIVYTSINLPWRHTAHRGWSAPSRHSRNHSDLQYSTGIFKYFSDLIHVKKHKYFLEKLKNTQWTSIIWRMAINQYSKGFDNVTTGKIFMLTINFFEGPRKWSTSRLPSNYVSGSTRKRPAPHEVF